MISITVQAILLLCIMHLGVNAHLNSTKNDKVGIYPMQLEMGIKKGLSYQGKTLRELQPGESWVEVAGGVENLSIKKLVIQTREVVKGFSWRMPDIKPGYSEAFLSIKYPLTATGVWVRYTFVLDDDLLFHIMFSAPFNFNHYDNVLAIGLCMRTDPACRDLNAEKMYVSKHSFLDRKAFTDFQTGPVKICFDNYCATGYMESDHRPVIIISLYPKSYMNLYPEVRRHAIDQQHYEDFIKTLFK